MLKQTKKRVYIALIVVFAIFVLLFFYINVIYTVSCQNYECWQKYMKKCNRASFISEQPEASWGYQITGKTDSQCNIEVTLLLAKKGELGIEKLVGETMTCSYNLGIATYAESDINACHGLLKEDLLTLRVNKLHSYLLENLGKVSEGLEPGI